MATRDLFEASTEADLIDALARIKRETNQRQRDDFRLAIDYLEGRQRDDVESQLRDRYPRTQTGKVGGDIAAQTIPLTQRYVAEAANAYNKPHSRKLVEAETGEESDATRKATDELRAMLSAANYGEVMHRNEQFTVLCRTSGVWFQARAGKLRPTITHAHDVFPAMPAELTWHDPADQSDYMGYAVRLAGESSKGSGKASSRFAWLEPARTAFYHGSTVYDVDGDFDSYDNPYMWPQTIDTDDQRGATVTLPLQMLTLWHSELPVGSIIPDSDIAIAALNREINLQYSILMDTISHQGWSQMVLNVMDPGNPPPLVSAGPRNALAMGPEETATMLSSATSYADLVSALQSFVRLMAIASRQSPNDFALDGSAAQSGFAKLVDSLPKIEARADRIVRLIATEAQLAWPRIASIGSHLGLFSMPLEQLAKLRMVTTFEDIEMPLSVQEEIAKETHELANGLTSPAKLLAAKLGVSEERAQEIVNENLGISEEEGAVGEAPAVGGAGIDSTGVTADVQQLALNGAQVQSMVEVLQAAAAGMLPRDSVVAIISTAYQLSDDTAERIVGSIGAGFTQAQPQQQQPQNIPQPPEPKRKSGELLGSLIAKRRGGGAV